MKESEKEAQRENRQIIAREKVSKGERDGKGDASGRETQDLGSIHVITVPWNSCQGPSAAISLMKRSWCYEHSARRITSWITTQKPRMLKAQRLRNTSTIAPTCQPQLSTLCPPCLHGVTLKSQRVWPDNVTLRLRPPS